jgi:Xaa-Pro aminopeptidase
MATRLSNDFYKGRAAAVQAELQKLAGRGENLDGMLILNTANVIYVSGFFHIPSERPIGVYIPRVGEPILFAPLLEQENSTESWILDSRFYFEYPGEEDPVAWMLRETGARGATIGVDALDIGVARRVSNTVELVPSDVVNRMRWVKTPDEIALVEQAATYADYCLEVLLEVAPGMIREGATELDLLRACVGAASAKLAREAGAMFRLGGGGVVGTVHSGERAALPHGAPLEKRPVAGETLIAGIGASVGGYHAESGATFIIGEPSDDQWRCLRAADACDRAGIAALRAGATCSSVNVAALAELKAAGLSDAIRHRIGHGMGIESHEAPWLAPGDDTLLEAGMVFSNEPGIYRPGVDGYRTIDTMIVTDGAARVPSRFLAEHPPEKRIITL